jgi:hypothetical protein
MEDTKMTRPPLWVFGVLFLAYTVVHVALLLFVYSVGPSTPFVLAESVAIAGGAMAVAASVLAWRPTMRPASRKGIAPARPGMTRMTISRPGTTRLMAGRPPSRSTATSRR